MFQTAKQTKIFQNVVEQIQEAIFAGKIIGHPDEIRATEDKGERYKYLISQELRICNDEI